MRVKILGKDRDVAVNNGNLVQTWEKDSEHDVDDELGAALVRDKWAARVVEKAPVAEPKAADPAPDSK